MHAKDDFPNYRFPLSLVLPLLLALIRGSSRSIRRDARKVIDGFTPPIHIIGTENIPQQGPAMITLNHYARPGFSILWAAVAVSAQLPENQFWLMSSAWTNRTHGIWDLVRTFATRMLFKRLAEIYGLVNTPPMPPVDEELRDRAISIRKVLRVLKQKPETVLCIAPEGRDFERGTLGKPSAGTGRFIQHLAKHTQSIVPVGVWEGCGRLIINFGKAYSSTEILGICGEDTSRAVMDRIAQLLPTRIRNNYPGA